MVGNQMQSNQYLKAQVKKTTTKNSGQEMSPTIFFSSKIEIFLKHGLQMKYFLVVNKWREAPAE